MSCMYRLAGYLLDEIYENFHVSAHPYEFQDKLIVHKGVKILQ